MTFTAVTLIKADIKSRKNNKFLLIILLMLRILPFKAERLIIVTFTPEINTKSSFDALRQG